ncbi:hypothetical protein PAP_09335 [Palaeococcus pacificus DY20341]|uniref:DUF1102 domain-containing protein n=1 Tax=Palaeococcus pacificus DY20341 TaxID=1343739 RepID=A0A075LU51_9EURY|nr:DUF1102 domain-containing protein [Palaeococcus pacificus]AIF70245.1 hypothetical protein PAP_09335 [Palaeococcus pacificus DY20341]
MRKIIKISYIVIVLVVLFFSSLGWYVERPIPVVYAVPDNASNFSIENPLPPYSYLSNGVLKVEISNESPFYPGFGEGLSSNSTYVFEEVFEIKNNESETGFSEICVRVNSTSSNIAFFKGDYAGFWAQSIEFTVLADESVKVGIRFDTHGLPLGDYNQVITIEAFGGSCE